VKVTAVLLAGRRPGVDPLAAHFGTPDKALIPIEGEAMLSRVAKTLLSSPSVSNLILLAQEPALLTDRSDTQWLAEHDRVSFAPSGASVSEGLSTLLRRQPDKHPFLVTTADNPLLISEMIEVFVASAAGSDLAAGLVEQRTLLASFPDARRTWLPFRKGKYSGANLFWLASPAVLPLLDRWRRIEQDRKRRWRVIGAFGPLMLVAALFRLLTVEQAFARIGRRYGLVARPIILPFAEACIDVDKISDFELAAAILSKRSEDARTLG
jgi:molybdopterin-guanine dinucleotide biosynthesis protein A